MIFWPTSFVLKKPPCPRMLVELHLLPVKQDVQADLQRAQRGEEVHAHEVGQREAASGVRTNNGRPSSCA
jgi:hypothetical protein